MVIVRRKRLRRNVGVEHPRHDRDHLMTLSTLEAFSYAPLVDSPPSNEPRSAAKLRHAPGRLLTTGLAFDYLQYNELVWRPGMLPPSLVEKYVDEAERLRPHVVRKRVPGYKKSG